MFSFWIFKTFSVSSETRLEGWLSLPVRNNTKKFGWEKKVWINHIWTFTQTDLALKYLSCSCSTSSWAARRFSSTTANMTESIPVPAWCSTSSEWNSWTGKHGEMFAFVLKCYFHLAANFSTWGPSPRQMCTALMPRRFPEYSRWGFNLFITRYKSVLKDGNDQPASVHLLDPLC